MSRSTATPTGGRPQPAAELDPQTGRPTTAGAPAQRAAQPQPPQQQGYAPQQGYAQPPQPGYHQGYAPANQGYAPANQAAPAGYGQPQQYAQQPGYAEPAYDPAAPGAAYGQGYGYQPDYNYGQPGEPLAAQAVPATRPPQPSLSIPQAPAAQPAARGYAPQFDAYVPSSQPAAQPAASYGQPDPHAGYGQQGQGSYASAAANEGLSRLSPRGRQVEPTFAQPAALPQTDPYAHQQWQQPADYGAPPPAQGLDTGGYYPQGYDQAGHPQSGHPQSGHPPHPSDIQFAEWPGTNQAGVGGYAPEHDPHQGYQPAHAGQPGNQQYRFDQAAPAALDAGHEQHHDDEAAEHEEEAEEAPRRRGGFMMVAGALAAAVVVGGGLAYGYQKFMGKPGVEVATPVVKGTGAPAKAKPTDPGGKQFAHTDSKVMGRLSEGGSSAAEDPNGPRKVTTIPIGRDGSLTPPAPDQAAAAPAPQAPPPAAAAPVSVPGMTIVDGFGGRPPLPAARPAPPPVMPAPVAAVPAAPAKPVVVARTTPTTATDAQDAAEAAPVVTPKKAATAVKKKVVDAFGAAGGAAPAAPAATTSPSGGAGYVAVLASVPMSSNSRMDALKQFADLQQRYSGVLSDKTPDVQEANLGDKGNYHRLLVGPPGSRDQASGLCSQLKAAGYAGCWVKAY